MQLERVRELPVKRRTHLINAMRGHATAFGVIAARGTSRVPELGVLLRRSLTRARIATQHKCKPFPGAMQAAWRLRCALRMVVPCRTKSLNDGIRSRFLSVPERQHEHRLLSRHVAMECHVACRSCPSTSLG